MELKKVSKSSGKQPIYKECRFKTSSDGSKGSVAPRGGKGAEEFRGGHWKKTMRSRDAMGGLPCHTGPQRRGILGTEKTRTKEGYD